MHTSKHCFKKTTNKLKQKLDDVMARRQTHQCHPLGKPSELWEERAAMLGPTVLTS